jgi:two-component system, NarL family, nitrate/nitrite response regulator NarL
MQLVGELRGSSRDCERAACIALVEDHQLLSAALSAALRAEGYDVIVPVLTTLTAVQAELLRAVPDFTLLDMDLGEVGAGEELIEPLIRAGSIVLLVSGTGDRAAIGRCLERGAAGWVSKCAPLEQLLRSIAAMVDGRPAIGAGERQPLVDAWHEECRSVAAVDAVFDRLTRRESAVLMMLMDGQTVDRISAASFVSEATVRTQVRGILQKLGVNSQLEAVAMAARLRWMPTG